MRINISDIHSSVAHAAAPDASVYVNPSVAFSNAAPLSNDLRLKVPVPMLELPSPSTQVGPLSGELLRARIAYVRAALQQAKSELRTVNATIAREERELAVDHGYNRIVDDLQTKVLSADVLDVATLAKHLKIVPVEVERHDHIVALLHAKDHEGALVELAHVKGAVAGRVHARQAHVALLHGQVAALKLRIKALKLELRYLLALQRAEEASHAQASRVPALSSADAHQSQALGPDAAQADYEGFMAKHAAESHDQQARDEAAHAERQLQKRDRQHTAVLAAAAKA